MHPAIENPRTILVIKPSSLGDVVHTLPAVRLVKERWPQSQITWLVNPEWAPVLAENPDLAAVPVFPRNDFRGWRGLARFRRWLHDFGAAKFDLVLDFQGLLRSAVIARAACGGAIAGLSDAREGARFFYHHVADVSRCTHAVDRYLQLAESVGARRSGSLHFELPTGAAPVGFEAASPYVVLHPFSRGEGKSLTREQIAAFCAAFADRRIVIAGRSSEPVPAGQHIVNLLNRTSLAELCWVLARADLVVSVDSGPMHMAAALGARLLSIHTWSDPRRVGPYPASAYVWDGRVLCQVRELGKTAGVPQCHDLVQACRAFSERIASERSAASQAPG